MSSADWGMAKKANEQRWIYIYFEVCICMSQCCSIRRVEFRERKQFLCTCDNTFSSRKYEDQRAVFIKVISLYFYHGHQDNCTAPRIKASLFKAQLGVYPTTTAIDPPPPLTIREW